MLQDIASVVRCVPGAELDGAMSGNTVRGRMTVAIGPMRPAFNGIADVHHDAAAQSGRVIGRGSDRVSRSSLDGEMTFKLHGGVPTNPNWNSIYSTSSRGRWRSSVVPPSWPKSPTVCSLIPRATSQPRQPARSWRQQRNKPDRRIRARVGCACRLLSKDYLAGVRATTDRGSDAKWQTTQRLSQAFDLARFDSAP